MEGFSEYIKPASTTTNTTSLTTDKTNTSLDVRKKGEVGIIPVLTNTPRNKKLFNLG